MSDIFVSYEKNIFQNLESRNLSLVSIFSTLQNLFKTLSTFSVTCTIFSILQRIEWVSKQTLVKEEFPKVIGPLNTHPKTVKEATKPYEFFKILPKKILR